MKTKMPNMMLMLKIYELYPNRIVVTAIEDKDSEMWSAALIEYNNFALQDTIYVLDGYVYKTSEEALKEIDKILHIVIESVKIMAN